MRHLALIAIAPLLVLASPAVFAASTYEISAIPSASLAAGFPTWFRVNVATGQVMSYYSGTKFTPVNEPVPPPPGEYHLHLSLTLDGKGTWWVMRMDSRSGRVWQLAGGGNNAPLAWTEITAP
jgi:hypothetical protein